MPSTISCDVAIVGGGLAGGLIALALKKKKPNCYVRLIEGSARIGGNHLWSFFGSDIAPADRWLAAPLISYGWASYDVAFPAHERTLKAPYYSIESERFDRLVRAALPKKALMLRRKAIDVTPTAVALSGGDLVQAEGVIDCRGTGDLSKLDLGWQKFLGQQLRIRGGHGLTRPVIMDATVPQIDGYRFVYCLPFDAETVFVEDTYYSDTPELAVTALRQRIADYAGSRGWTVEAIEREETGILPVAMGGNFDAYWASGGSAAKAGVRGALFHPTTGYSLPDAVRLAAWFAHDPDLAPERMENHTAALWVERRFYRLLDVMLFRAAQPYQRYKILERFYRLSPALIGRFYAGQSTLADKIRILSGRPPVPIAAAVRALWESRA